MKEISQYVGAMIRKRRVEMGHTQLSLATELGIHDVTLCDYEKGNLSISVPLLVRIAQFLETPMTYFLPDTRPSNPIVARDSRTIVMTTERLRSLTKEQRSLIYKLLGHMGAK